MSAKLIVAKVLLTAAIAASARADTYYVNGECGNDAWTGKNPECQAPDGPKATIQAGMDTASNGDEVIVADWTYTGPGNKNLDFGGKAIMVRSANGPEDCIIDCEGDGRGFYFHSGETAESVLEGFTITHGYAVFGGGLYCLDKSSPTISNCIISENEAYSGGGVCCNEGSIPTISSCLIAENSAYWDGGGIHLRFCGYISLDIADSLILNNTAGWDGGGVHCYDSQIAITGCRIIGNRAENPSMIWPNGGGGGLYLYSNPPATHSEVINCVIADNVAVGHGGGVMAHEACLAVQLSTISGNYATNGGGCVLVDGPGGSPYGTYFTSCTIAANVARLNGGALYLWNNQDTGLINCTVVANMAGREDGGICYAGVSHTSMESCILWDNPPLPLGPMYSSCVYSNIQGGKTGTGNINADPLFVDADGPDNDPLTWEDNDYHLLPGSPCIDSGYPYYGGPPHHPGVDLDGRARIVNDRVDMGPYECHAGDLNCDLMRTFDDIDPFVLAMSGKAAYLAQYPDCEWLNADCNCDGTVDFNDIDPFVALLSP